MNPQPKTAAQLSTLYENACLQELQALKPGNVHIFAAGHDMDVEHFMQSAKVSAKPIADPEKTVGERILAAIKATNAEVGMNTNLGIVLLCAPILHAYAAVEDGSGDVVTSISLQNAMTATLSDLTINDAHMAAEAVVLAKPAGLGTSDAYDVNEKPAVTLYDMMQYAARKDRIAYQYVNQFADVFELGLSSYHEAMQNWNNAQWATSWVYLNFLAHIPDTHIVRKYGDSVAVRVLNSANAMKEKVLLAGHPKLLIGELLAWDMGLKKEKINPGTSADLTVSTLLTSSLV